jgi:antitoxin HicB
MKMMRYTVTLAPDDNGTLLVTVPDIPEALTFGRDREDALARAIDAIETAIMGYIAAREDIPKPRARGADSVELPPLSVAKIELYRAMRADSVGKAELGRRLGVALPQIDRLLDLRHRSRLDALVDAFAALNRTLDIVVKTAA